MTGAGDDPITISTRAALEGLAHLLLAEESTQSVLQRVVDSVAQVMPVGAEASLTLVRDQRPTTAAFSGEMALHLDEMQYERGYGPCLEAARDGQAVAILDGRTETRWPEYVPTFLRYGALSSLAVPVPAAHLAAGLNVYALQVDALTDTHRDAVEQFAAYTAVALTNLDALQDARGQAENLRVAMESRAAIEQAKGILIERYKLTPDQAFRLLVEASMYTNRRVRDLAEHLVLTGEMPPVVPPGGARAPADVAHRRPPPHVSRPRQSRPPPDGNQP